jgi:uncharacterized protein with von Willebrand factor type A (vWA) domain
MDKILEFIKLLRDSGIRIAVSEVLDAYKALCKIEVADKEVFRNVLQCTLVKTSEDIEKFDKIFELYFVVIDKEEEIDDNEFNDIVDDLKDKLDDFNLNDNNEEDNTSSKNNEFDESGDNDSCDGSDSNNEDEQNENDLGSQSDGGDNERESKENNNSTDKNNDICNTDSPGGSSAGHCSDVSNADDMSANPGNDIPDIDSNSSFPSSSYSSGSYDESNTTSGNNISSANISSKHDGKEITDTLSNINKDFSNAFDMHQKETSIQDISEIYKYGSDAELKMKAEELANIQFDINDKNDIKGTAERLLIKNKLEFAKAVAKRNSSPKSQKNVDKKYEELKEYLKNAIEKNLVQQFGTDIISELTSEDTLCDSDLASLEYNDLDKVNAIIKKMVKKLKTNVSRKLQIGKKGKISIRQTIKKSMQSGNVCSDLVFKRKRLDKSKLIVLCDISGSVCIYVPFMLQFVKAVADNFDDLRTFLFIDKIQEVFLTEETNISKVCNDYPISFSSGTDYTNVFKEMNELDINKKTVLIVLGDAENTADINAKDEFKCLAEKVKTVYWLNPVDEKEWYEFSELKDYDPYITKVFRCKTIRDIENFVKALVKF